jgi:glyoxylate reductase
MMELFACRLNRDDKPLGKSELIVAVGHPDVLPRTVDDRIDGEVLAAAGPGARIEGRIAMGEKVIINSKTFAGGHRPLDRVICSVLRSIWSG